MLNIKEPNIKKVAELLKNNGTLNSANKHMKFKQNDLSIKHKFFALMISHCAALWRNDDVEAEKIVGQLDSIYQLIDESTQQEFDDACRWIAECVAEWPK